LKNVAEVFEKAMDISLDKKNPKRKRERRLEREGKRSELFQKSRLDEISAHPGQLLMHPQRLCGELSASALRRCAIMALLGVWLSIFN
jgi:hypothetical protein